MKNQSPLKSINMKAMKLQLFAAVVYLLSACNGGGNQDKNVVVLVDISKSIQADTKDWYIQTIQKDICPLLAKYDKITVLPIDGASQTAATALMEINFEEKAKEWAKITGINTNETNKMREEAKASFISEKMSELKGALQNANKSRAGVANATDIVGALHSVDNLFDEGFSNQLIIFSDMEQYGNQLKMNENGNEKSWIELAKQESYNHLKNYTVQIFTGQQLEMSVDYYNKIKNFWHLFFENKGVTNITYRSAETNTINASLNQ